MKKTTVRILSSMLCAVQVAGLLSFGTVASAAEVAKPSVDTIAVGFEHSLVVKKDLTLWAAGNNDKGQLGTGKLEDESDGVKIMDNVIATEANDDVSFAINAAGELYGWGDNSEGQIAPGDPAGAVLSPVKVMDNVISVSAGAAHTIAITADGTAYGWGSNEHGELGFDKNNARNKPVKLMENIADAAAGDGFTLLVSKTGVVYISGNNSCGQLGIGNYRDYDTFKALPIEDVAAAEAGNQHSVLLKKDGTVLVSGLNEKGQAAHAEKDCVSFFTDVGIKNACAVFAGGDSSAAVTSSGKTYVWGANNCGQLHNKKTENLHTPEVAVSSGVISVAFGENHSLMLKGTGGVNAVGSGIYGQLFRYGDSAVPRPEKVLDEVVQYSAGKDHSAAIDADGVLYTWGNNDCGQLGTGDYSVNNVPTKVELRSAAKMVWCGDKCTFVQTVDNRMYVFGDNGGYLLAMDTESPTICKPTENYYFSDVVDADIHFGNGFCAAILDGVVYGWGTNVSNRLVDCPSVVKVPMELCDDLGTVSDLAVGDNFCLALESTGVLYGWGANGSRQLGKDFDTAVVTFPREIEITDAKTDESVYLKDIDAAGANVMAIDDGGRVWVWGTNLSGQLGTATARLKTPQKMPYLANDIEAGLFSCAVIDTNERLLTSGSNKNGALGTDDRKDRSEFALVASSVVAVELGDYFGGYLRDDGALLCWGDNTYGQVGTGTGGVSVKAETTVTGALCDPLSGPDSVKLSKEQLIVKPGNTAKLTAEVKPVDAEIKTVMWTSSDTSVATVSADGTVKGIKKGTSIITATVIGGASASCQVNVTIPVSSFSVSPSKSKSMKPGDSFTFKTKVYPSNAADKTLVFETSDPEVATVSAKGKVKAVAPGVAEITVYPRSNPDKTRTVTINVRPAKPKISSRKATADGVVLKWKEIAGADGYTIYRRTSKGGKAVAVADVDDALRFTDDTAKAGKTYYYTIKAYVEVDGKKIYSSESKKYKIKAK